MVRAIKGVLVECDPSIKSIIINIDSDSNEYIIEDLDETHLVIKEMMLAQLKQKLEDRLKENLPTLADNDSDSDRDVK